ncbi:MAG TPA: 3'-5' exonuclease [Verrucomicrobiae bacterium]|nr:3'-5' exonuclease [Verrucomicrobiae bacterium]
MTVWSACRTVRLEQNYRSTAHILNAANAVIRNNSVRKDKTLWTDGGDGSPIDLVVAEDDEDEASTVVERIQAEIYKKDLSFRDFAILYRTNAQSRSFEEQLRFQSIPYVLVGGFRFFDRKEVKDSISYLRVMDNPSDEQALYRIINFPRRGIGEGTVGKINTWSLEHKTSLFEALGRVQEIPGISDAARLKILELHRLLTEWSERFRGSRALSRNVKELFEELKLEDELFRTADDPQAGRRKVENLEQVVNSVAAYEARHRGGLSDFLEKISLMDEERHDGKKKKGEETDAVTLMSLHASKGLEFPHVFLVGMEEEILPHGRTLQGDGSLEEERRLCYVGITRAREQLVLTRCSARRKYGRMEERTPSRFLQEIPEGVMRAGQAEPATEEEQAQMAKNFFSKVSGLFD